VAVVYRWAENQLDRLPELATELVRRQVTVIAPPTTSCALAVKALTTTIPIVFLTPEDPVRFGLVASLARPGGNLTGVMRAELRRHLARLRVVHEQIRAIEQGRLRKLAAPPLIRANSMAHLTPQPAGCASKGFHPLRMERRRIDGLLAAHSEPQRIQRRNHEQRQRGRNEQAAQPRRCCRRAGSFPGWRQGRSESPDAHAARSRRL
jgi:ABC transporter substrate binding protein